MGLRESMDKHSVVVAVLALAILIACVMFIGRGMWGGGRTAGPGDSYYYDLNTETVFVDKSSAWSPIEAPSGPDAKGNPAGVKAVILACGSCGSNYDGMSATQVEEAGAVIAYLQVNPKPSSSEREGGPGGIVPMMMDPLLRAVEGGDWIRGASSAGMNLTTAVRDRCGKKEEIQMCNP